MKKYLLLVCTLLLLLPACAASALNMTADGNYIYLPDYDNPKLYFRNPDQWTFITPDNFEEHMDVLIARGDTEENIRERFAREGMVFEAYSGQIKKDACIRLEMEEDADSRDIWHLKTLSTKERTAFQKEVMNGQHLTNYDTFTFKWQETGKQMYAEIGFTSVPPCGYESGVMNLRYFNGKRYILTYAVSGRRAGRSKLRGTGENEQINKLTPLSGSYFSTCKGEMEPAMPSYSLDEAFPTQVDVGDVTITGKVREGAKMSATLDGEDVKVKVTSKGKFTLELPIKTAGDHDVSITVTHSKNTTRVENYTLNASASRTPLTLTEKPEDLAKAGDQVISGQTEPGAQIILRLDTEDELELTADADGRFTHTFDVMDDQVHLIQITATAPGKDPCRDMVIFVTEYETIRDGVKAFQKNLTDHTIAKMAKDPESYVGERVKISVRVKEVTYTDKGLGILCTYNPPSGSKAAKTPLYLTLYGYAQDQISDNMVMTVYGTVEGAQQVGDESRLSILVQYGTYLVSKQK